MKPLEWGHLPQDQSQDFHWEAESGTNWQKSKQAK